jgi:hypothetical protein
MFGLGKFLMGDAKIVGTANQVHARVQGAQAGSRVPTLASQAGQTLSKRSIQAFDKGRIEDFSSARKPKQLLSSLQHPVSHLAGDLDHPFFLAPFDHRPNVQIWPDL